MNNNSKCPFCEKSFKHLSSIYRHKNNCKYNNNKICNTNNNENNNKLIDYLLKENNELKQMILDVCKNSNISHNTNSFNNTNSNNKSFNLHFFLNETCKNAMNINDFVESIKLELADLINVGEIGYVQGISNIIVKNLNSLDITERPIHCTDKKREVLYVKDENKWEKEDEEKKKIRSLIKKIAYENQRLILQYREKYPGCNLAHNKNSEKYNKMIIEAMGGSGDNDIEKENKIISNISKVISLQTEK
jgi:hypothetical protein